MNSGQLCYTGVTETLLSYLHFIFTSLECNLIWVTKLCYGWSLIPCTSLTDLALLPTEASVALYYNFFKLQKVGDSCQKGGPAYSFTGPCIFHIYFCGPTSTHTPRQPQEAGPADKRSSEK